MADTKLLLVLVSFLTLGTILTGAVLLSYNSWNDTGKDFYTQSCPRGSYYCQSPEMNLTEYVNFTTSCMSIIDPFFYQPEPFSILDDSGRLQWRCRQGIGLISEGQRSLYGTLFEDFSWILFNNVQLQNDSYKNVYVVNNTYQDPMAFTLEYVNGNNENLYLVIRSHWVHIKGGETAYDYLVPGFYNILYQNPTFVTTEYNPVTSHIKVVINGLEFNTTVKISRPLVPNLFQTIHYYGGVGAYDRGLNVREIHTYARSLNKADIWGSILGFFGTISGLVTFNTDVLCSSVNGEIQCIPWFIIVLFVYIPGLAILAILVDMFMPDWL